MAKYHIEMNLGVDARTLNSVVRRDVFLFVSHIQLLR